MDESMRSAAFAMAALQAARAFADRYGIKAGEMKSCVAILLDGNLGGCARHEAAFVIAIELRRLGLQEGQANQVLLEWARTIGYPPRSIAGPLRNAFGRKPNGDYRYHPPGFRKERGVYKRVLQPFCQEIGCPENCLQYLLRARRSESDAFERFEEQGWVLSLNRRRCHAAVHVYRAICELERERRIAPGAPQLTSYKQLAERAQVDPKTVGRSLRVLAREGLLEVEFGSGSGPHARDRKPSQVTRLVPVPPTPPFIEPQ